MACCAILSHVAIVPSTKHRELQSSIPVAIGDIRRASLNAVRLAVLAELVEAHSPFDRLRANELKRTVLRQALGETGSSRDMRVDDKAETVAPTVRRNFEAVFSTQLRDLHRRPHAANPHRIRPCRGSARALGLGGRARRPATIALFFSAPYAIEASAESQLTGLKISSQR